MRSVGPLELEQRRLSHVHVAVFYQRTHVPKQQSQQQGSDVLTVDIRVGHQNALVVANLADIKLFTDAGTEGSN